MSHNNIDSVFASIDRTKEKIAKEHREKIQEERNRKRKELQSNSLIRKLMGGTEEDLAPFTPEEQDLLAGNDTEHLIVLDDVVCRIDDNGNVIAPAEKAKEYAGKVVGLTKEELEQTATEKSATPEEKSKPSIKIDLGDSVPDDESHPAKENKPKNEKAVESNTPKTEEKKPPMDAKTPVQNATPKKENPSSEVKKEETEKEPVLEIKETAVGPDTNKDAATKPNKPSEKPITSKPELHTDTEEKAKQEPLSFDTKENPVKQKETSVATDAPNKKENTRRKSLFKHGAGKTASTEEPATPQPVIQQVIVQQSPVMVNTDDISVLAPVMATDTNAKMYFAVSYNERLKKAAYATIIKRPDDTDAVISSSMYAKDINDAIFYGAIDSIEFFEQMDVNTLTIYTDALVGKKLRRNSQFMIDSYSDATSEYMKFMKDVATRKYIDVAPAGSELPYQKTAQAMADALCLEYPGTTAPEVNKNTNKIQKR